MVPLDLSQARSGLFSANHYVPLPYAMRQLRGHPEVMKLLPVMTLLLFECETNRIK